jgi:hypothetical protein
VEDDGSAGGLGLVEFLGDLREDLRRAQEQALQDAGGKSGDSDRSRLWLGVEQITVTVEVAHGRTVSGELGGKVKGKFLVFGSAEASGKAGAGASRSGTQTLTLTLRPRVETTWIDDQGGQWTTSSGLDVHGKVGEAEQQPPPHAQQKPRPPTDPSAFSRG